MNRLQITLQTILFCIFPLRFLIQWLPILGYPIIATFFILVEYAALFSLIMHSVIIERDSQNKRANVLFQIIYWIYSSYLIYYIIINPLLPRDAMLHVPPSDLNVIQEIVMISIFCSIITLYQNLIDYTFFFKISTIFLTAMLIIHATMGNMSIYMIQTLASNEDKLELLNSFRMLDGISLAKYGAMAFIFNLCLKGKWSENYLQDTLIFWGVAFVSLSNVIITTQRGPLLFLITTVIIYFYCKERIGPITVFLVLSSALLFFLLSDIIIPWLASHVPHVFDRFFLIADDAASGRFGFKESEYALALRQISEEPFLGTYFRTTLGPREGNYPHNFILELLMTFGVVFTIPFLVLFLHAVKNTITALRLNWSIAPIGLIFIFFFSLHLSSESIAFNTESWVSMAMALCFNEYTDE